MVFSIHLMWIVFRYSTWWLLSILFYGSLLLDSWTAHWSQQQVHIRLARYFDELMQRHTLSDVLHQLG